MTSTIAIICNTALHVQRSRTNLIDALQSSGARVVLVSPFDDSVPALQEMGVIHEHVDISQYGTNPIREIRLFWEIRAALRRLKPSICLCYTIKANTIGTLAARSLGISVINNIAGNGRAFEGSRKLFQALVIRLYALSLRGSDRVFFQNSDDMQFFLQHRMVPKALARRIPGSGVDIQRFKLSLNFPPDPVFLFVGRLLISKGAKIYMDAAAQMLEQGINARFILAGERLDESGYVSARDLDAFISRESCTYLGQVPPDQIAGLLSSCTFLVLPSYYGEGVPRTLLEAGAVGRPIISTDSVGCKDVVRHKVNGLEIAPRSQASLFNALREAAGMSPEQLLTLGRQSREIIERNFDEKIVIQAYLDECSRILARRRSVDTDVKQNTHHRIATRK